MPRSVLVGNWKMQLSFADSVALAQAIAPRCHDLRNTDVLIAPAFTAIPAVAEVCKGIQIQVGGQNVHWSEKGQFTGEISAKMLQELGCTFAIVGHSERRNKSGEGIEQCSRRALGALSFGLQVIFCIGEFADERREKRTNEVLTAQLAPFLSSLPREHRDRCMIAYEPVWAVGSGLAATSKEISETTSLIQQSCKNFMQGETLPVLYGGSVTPKNFESVIRESSVAGALIGTSSLSASDFIAMIEMSEGV